MKKNFLYTALFALMLASCSEQEVIEQPSTPTGGTEVQLPADVTSGELLIKFDPAMTEILDQALTVATRMERRCIFRLQRLPGICLP